MDKPKVVAFSADRKRRIVVTQRPDGLYALVVQRLLDLDDRGEYNEPAERPFPYEGAIAPSAYYLDDFDGDGSMYGSAKDAEREAEILIRKY